MDYRYDFSDNKGRKTKKIIFIVIFLIFVIMFVCFFLRNNSNSVISKISSVISSPINLVYNIFNSNKDSQNSDIEKVRQENETLRAENETLKYQVLESQKILDENTTYKQMLNQFYVRALLHGIIWINSYFIISGEKFYNEDTGVE